MQYLRLTVDRCLYRVTNTAHGVQGDFKTCAAWVIVGLNLLANGVSVDIIQEWFPMDKPLRNNQVELFKYIYLYRSPVF